MTTPGEDRWIHEYAIETSAQPPVVWRLFSDVSGWKRWNAGVAEIKMDGPFAAGTRFIMTLPDGEMVTSLLVVVDSMREFIDETRLGDLVVRVSHRIEPQENGLTRIVYNVESIGPGCEDVGAAVSADFPDVLQALALLAESGA